MFEHFKDILINSAYKRIYYKLGVYNICHRLRMK